MKQKYHNSSTPFSSHIICCTHNNFGHVEKEYRNKSMDIHKQLDKKSNKNVVSKIPEKDGYTNTSHNNKKEEEKNIMCSFSMLI